MHAESRGHLDRSATEPLLVRNARVDDAEAVEAVHFASREAAYAGRVADWPPPGPDREGRVSRWKEWLADPQIWAIVAEVEERIVGFCTIRASKDEGADERTAEMPTLYVSPESWHRGYGRALCTASIDLARERGFEALTLWVLDMNARARSFYEHLGFAADGATQVSEMTHERLVYVRYRMDLSTGDAP